MPRRFRQHLLILATIGGIAGSLMPGVASSRDGAHRDVRVVHRTIGLSQNDLRDPDSVGAAVRQFAGSVYDLGAAPSSPSIPLSEFTGTMGQQARREKWVSLVLDVWVGGDGTPVGYYFRYEGRSAAGDLVRGESFLTSPDGPAKALLTNRTGPARRMIDAYASLLKPETFLDIAGR